MPYTADDFAKALARCTDDIRWKAADYANELEESGEFHPMSIVAVASRRAISWARTHGLEVSLDDGPRGHVQRTQGRTYGQSLSGEISTCSISSPCLRCV